MYGGAPQVDFLTLWMGAAGSAYRSTSDVRPSCLSTQVAVDVALQIGRDRCNEVLIGYGGHGFDAPDLAHHCQAHHLRGDQTAAHLTIDRAGRRPEWTRP